MLLRSPLQQHQFKECASFHFQRISSQSNNHNPGLSHLAIPMPHLTIPVLRFHFSKFQDGGPQHAVYAVTTTGGVCPLDMFPTESSGSHLFGTLLKFHTSTWPDHCGSLLPYFFGQDLFRDSRPDSDHPGCLENKLKGSSVIYERLDSFPIFCFNTIDPDWQLYDPNQHSWGHVTVKSALCHCLYDPCTMDPKTPVLQRHIYVNHYATTANTEVIWRLHTSTLTDFHQNSHIQDILKRHFSPN
jgi:hypothetical protein